MKLEEIGEFGFIERFKPWFNGLVQETQVGIGDDCAIIPIDDEKDLLVTTDLLLEDVHFLREAITPEQLGYKSLAVNLSDIAAMGGIPICSFLSIAIPSDIDVEYLDAFMKGYQKLSAKYKTPLLGGDTTKSPKHLVINVCIIGNCSKGKARRRNMALADDAVCVTGYLGDSAGGLQAILNKLKPSPYCTYLLNKHRLPKPLLSEGQFLAGFSGVHAMMDISDGIGSDLNHILNSSGVAANINLDWLPISEQLAGVASRQGWDVIELSVGGGEDYELLLTIAADELATIQKEFQKKFKKPIVQIGTIIQKSPCIKWFRSGKEVNINIKGFNHFQ
ncbi:MAG: thiamine-phosphate kinase [Bacteroidales bacterium]|jgi:thiamine-monophosphate kinase